MKNYFLKYQWITMIQGANGYLTDLQTVTTFAKLNVIS